MLSKKKIKKRSSQKLFKRSPQKNVFQKIFQALHKILTIQKIVLSSSRGQDNFRGLEASRPRPRLDLRGQGQGLQNLSSRTSSRPRTSSRTPPLITDMRQCSVFWSTNTAYYHSSKTLKTKIQLEHVLKHYVTPNYIVDIG